jgi:pyruvate/2-oxoglutarate dehydrogenase complex dihydrolipoamide dehydrogenase (E3) component
VYELTHLPQRLIVVGSGVTGAEFAAAYRAMGSDVVLVSSRDRVLPGEDADAAAALLVRAGGIRANGCMRCRATCRRLGVRTAATRRVHERASDRVRAPLREQSRRERSGGGKMSQRVAAATKL